jgi:hypothetical protein
MHHNNKLALSRSACKRRVTQRADVSDARPCKPTEKANHQEDRYPLPAPYHNEPSQSSSLSVPAYHFDASSAFNKLRPIANMTEHSRRHFQSLVSLEMHLD